MLKHILIAFAYLLLAVAVALVLPGVVPMVGMVEAWLAGGMVALAGVIAHECWARSEAHAIDRIRDQALREHVTMLRHDLDRVQGDILRLDESMTALAEGGESQARKDLERVVSEVQVLQSLIERVSSGASVKAPPVRPQEEAEAPKSGEPIREALGDAEILEIVSEGLKRDRVDLYLQPVVSLPQRKTRFYECFSHIRAEDGGIVLPDQYLEVAKREGLMGAIDNLLLFRCVQLVRRAQTRNHSVGFFCNISANTLADRAFFADFIDFLAANREPAKNLIFEFRQDDMAEHPQEIDEYIARLGRLGFYFSLDRLHDLTKLDIPQLARKRFRYIKIESSYLLDKTDAEEPANDTAPVNENDAATLVGVNVAALKRVLDVHGIDLIVEKLESEQDLIELLDYRIDYGQGYLFGEPRLSKEAPAAA